MNKIRFAKASLDALTIAEGGKPAYYYDEKSRGLCIFVSTKVKTFYALRKVRGKTERVMLGRYPDTTIEQARKRAAEVNSKIDSGVNPNELKRERRRELTLNDLFAVYMERHARPHNRRPDNAQNNFRRYLSQWGNRKLSDIEKRDVVNLHVKLGNEIGHVTANIALTLLRAMFNRASEWDMWKGDNPTSRIRKFKEQSRERFLLPDEMPRFLDALREVENETMRDFFLMLLLTGARRGNVMEMRWQDIHLEDALWKIPDTKSGEPHTVALVSEAVAILKKRRGIEAGGFVFSGNGKTGHLEEPKKAWATLRKKAGFEGLRMHDLRRTHGSWMAATGANLTMIGKALGHKNLATTTIYARLNIDPVRQAVSTAASAMMLGAGNLIPQAKVISIQQEKEKRAVRGTK